jgi:hypothetical protein
MARDKPEKALKGVKEEYIKHRASYCEAMSSAIKSLKNLINEEPVSQALVRTLITESGVVRPEEMSDSEFEVEFDDCMGMDIDEYISWAIPRLKDLILKAEVSVIIAERNMDDSLEGVLCRKVRNFPKHTFRPYLVYN